MPFLCWGVKHKHFVRKRNDLKGVGASPKLHLQLHPPFIAFPARSELSFEVSRQRHFSNRTCPLTGSGAVESLNFRRLRFFQNGPFENAVCAGNRRKRT